MAMFRGTHDIAHKAFEVINDNEIEIVCSDALWLELMPKPLFNKNQEEVEFYQAIFDQSEYVRWDLEVLNDAKNIAKSYGIAAMDAIHVSTAVHSRVDSLYTTEKPTKPMFRVPSITIISLASVL
jgi:hypothetical protein